VSSGVGSTEPPNSAGAGSAGAGADMSEPTFEQAQRELERIVERLERGDVDLDETLALWQRGEELYRLCRTRLDGAQGRIEELARQAKNTDRTESG